MDISGPGPATYLAAGIPCYLHSLTQTLCCPLPKWPVHICSASGTPLPSNETCWWLPVQDLVVRADLFAALFKTPCAFAQKKKDCGLILPNADI